MGLALLTHRLFENFELQYWMEVVFSDHSSTTSVPVWGWSLDLAMAARPLARHLSNLCDFNKSQHLSAVERRSPECLLCPAPFSLCALLSLGLLFHADLLTWVQAGPLWSFPRLWELSCHFCIGSSLPSPLLQLSHTARLAFTELWVSCSRAEWQVQSSEPWVNHSSFASQRVKGVRLSCCSNAAEMEVNLFRNQDYVVPKSFGFAGDSSLQCPSHAGLRVGPHFHEFCWSLCWKM